MTNTPDDLTADEKRGLARDFQAITEAMRAHEGPLWHGDGWMGRRDDGRPCWIFDTDDGDRIIVVDRSDEFGVVVDQWRGRTRAIAPDGRTLLEVPTA